MEFEYYIDPSVLRRRGGKLFTQIDELPVALHGVAEEYEKPATTNYPAQKMTARAATQADLKRLYDEGNPTIKRRQKPAEEPKELPKNSDTDGDKKAK